MTATARNVVFLTVDALRADHLSSHGYERETTPVLDRLAHESAHFTNAVSPSSHTREAVPAILSGRDPMTAVGNDYSLATNTVAADLGAAGYATGGFHSNPYVSRAYGYGEGFDTFDDDLYFGRHRLVALAQRALDKLRNRHYAPAETINQRALDWIDVVEEPFFCWVHYMDPHGPYAPPTAYQKQFHGERIDARRPPRLYRDAIEAPEDVTATECREMIDCYDGEIRYTDEAIGAFLEGLDDRGLRSETLLIVTADHGDGFGDHGYYGHPRQLYDDLLGVPLIVDGPDVPSVTVQRPVSTLDVVPTILSAAGLEAADYPGRPLVSAWSGERSRPTRAFASVRGQDDESNRRRFAIRTSRWKLILDRDVESGDLLASEAYDLAADPDEQDPLDPQAIDAAEAAQTWERLRTKSARQVRVESADGEQTGEVNPDVQRRLETLGYK